MKACKYIFFISLILTSMEVLHGKSISNICKNDKPHIQFPFKVNSFCKHNQTMLNFRGYGYLGVKSIYNDLKKLTLTDPKDCVFEVFLNLNLDSSPFRYYHVVKNYTYLNCSTHLLDSFEPVPCLSGSKHHVYVVESSLHVPGSCEVVKTVLIPFAYSSYVSDDSFGLDLTWDASGFNDFEEEKREFGFWSIGEELSIVILVCVVGGLGCVKVYRLKKSRLYEHEWETHLGDFESFYNYILETYVNDQKFRTCDDNSNLKKCYIVDGKQSLQRVAGWSITTDFEAWISRTFPEPTQKIALEITDVNFKTRPQ